MITREIQVSNDAGLTARAAATFVQHTNRFSSDIYLHLPGGTVDAKSIMGIISMGIRKGTVITITCEGIDENKAIDDLEELFAQGLGR